MLASFRREVALMSLLRNRNVVSLVGVVLSSSSIAVVMEVFFFFF